MNLNRRNFLKSSALTASALTMQNLFMACNSMPKQPNVLFVICDDLNDAIEGMGGHPQAITPHIDQFMKSGVQFTNAHSNCPLCGPSRASLWSGLHPHTTGYYGHNQNNNTWRDNPTLKDTKTIFEHFHDNGYSVYATGKIFHDNQHTYPMFNYGERFGVAATFGPFPWDGKAEDPRKIGHPSMPAPWGRHAFETFVPLSDVPEIKPDPENGIPGYKGWVLPYLDEYGKDWWEKKKKFRYESEEERDLTIDEMSVEFVKEKLSRKHDKPFFITMGFLRPHSPWIAPKKYFDLFNPDEIELPPYLENDLDDCTPLIKNFKKQGIIHWTRFDRIRKAWKNEEGWRLFLRGYLACAAFVDDLLGQTLAALKASPNADNTIVVFTSDHGHHLGEKNLIRKNTVWEESTRVPLVIKAPGVSKSDAVCDQPVSLVDIYPTLVDLCNQPDAPNTLTHGKPLDGFSLKPLLKYPEHGVWGGSDAVISSTAGQAVEVGEPGDVNKQNFTIRTKDWRYAIWSDGFEELYDHKNDPNEWHNLAPNAEYADIKKTLSDRLDKMTGRG